MRRVLMLRLVGQWLVTVTVVHSIHTHEEIKSGMHSLNHRKVRERIAYPRDIRIGDEHVPAEA